MSPLPVFCPGYDAQGGPGGAEDVHDQKPLVDVQFMVPPLLVAEYVAASALTPERSTATMTPLIAANVRPKDASRIDRRGALARSSPLHSPVIRSNLLKPNKRMTRRAPQRHCRCFVDGYLFGSFGY